MTSYDTSFFNSTPEKILIFFSLFIISIFYPVQIAFGASLSLSWNPNGEEDLEGYKIYYGTSSGNYAEPLDVGDVTSFELTGLDEGRRYYIALTAYDAALNQSEKSSEKSGVTSVITYTSTTTTIAPAVELENNIHNTGSVGAAAEDHYYIDIPNDDQSYLFIQLTGNPDADLYVRYGTSPTIGEWDCRPYTVDASNEHCFFSTPDSGRWYIMVRGYSGTVDYEIIARYGTGSPPESTTTTAPATTIPATDTSLPSGSVIINNGLLVTYSLNVILTLSAIDDGAELRKNGWMTFSNDNQEWSVSEPYTTAKFWTLSPGEGIKTVYVKFRDAAGNWMTTPARDHINYNGSETSCNQPQKLQLTATSASSQFLNSFPKENAVDGNPMTTWSTLLSFNGKDEFITLDLGAAKRISWLTMYPSTMFGTDFFPVNFKIEISRDSTTWDEITTEEGYAPPIQSRNHDNWDFMNLECRYIRVYITKAKTLFFFFKLAQIAEIEVYGCDSTAGLLTTMDAQQEHVVNKESVELSTDEISGKEYDGDNGRQPGTPGRPVVTFSE